MTAGQNLASPIIATAVDIHGNNKIDYTGEVWFTSIDAQATITHNTGNHYTFTSGSSQDNGVHTFATSEVVLKTSGNQTVTLKNGDGKADVVSSDINVTAAALDHFSLQTSATTAVAGSALPQSIIVSANDLYNNVQTSYTGQVWFTSTDGAATLTYNPANHYTFTTGGGGDNGTHSFAGSDFVLATAGNQTITLKNGDGKADQTTGNILVSAGGIDHFSISTTANTATAGSALPQPVIVNAYDASSNLKTDYTGEVWFTSTDGAATLTYNPGSHYTFTTGGGQDNGTHSFAGSDFVLATAGNQTITLKNGDGKADQTTGNILVSAGDVDHFTISTLANTATAGSALPQPVIVNAYDASSNLKTDYTGEVWFTSTDGAATLTYNPANHYIFTTGGGGDNGTHSFTGSDFVLATAGNQTITLKNSDGKADQTTGQIAVAPGAVDHITLNPLSLTLNSGDTGQFTAIPYDQFNNQRSDIITWSVIASGGTIDNTGLFTAGTTGGTFTNTIQASDGGVNSLATIVINAAPVPPTPPTPTPAPTQEAQESGEIKITPIVPTETASPTGEKKEDITITDFQFYVVLESGNIPLTVSDTNSIVTVTDSNVLVEISADIFAKKVNVITISTSGSTYLMNLLSDKNKYQAVLPMPAVKGDFELRILIVYEDGSLKEVKNFVLVDPQGYVYTLSSSYFGLGKKQEVRISDAKITLYKLDGSEYKLWDSAGKQPNPTISNKSGEYTFWVPNGDYYLTIEKAGYKTVKTANFKVENSLVTKNIKIEPKIKPWIWLIVILFVLAIIIYLIVRRRKKSKFVREVN